MRPSQPTVVRAVAPIERDHLCQHATYRTPTGPLCRWLPTVNGVPRRGGEVFVYGSGPANRQPDDWSHSFALTESNLRILRLVS